MVRRLPQRRIRPLDVSLPSIRTTEGAVRALLTVSCEEVLLCTDGVLAHQTKKDLLQVGLDLGDRAQRETGITQPRQQGVQIAAFQHRRGESGGAVFVRDGRSCWELQVMQIRLRVEHNAVTVLPELPQ